MRMPERNVKTIGRRTRLVTATARTWIILALLLIAVFAAGCYNNNTGETRIGGAINFKLPAFPETGSHAVQVFTEMHYQQSYRVQEGPRILPPADSVPVTGRELEYSSLEEYGQLSVPQSVVKGYDPTRAQELYTVNCAVCHGPTLRGVAEEQESARAKILQFMKAGPFPADLTAAVTKQSTDGELFAFILGGGRQGLAATLRDRESQSPMPQFKLLLTEEERWTLVQYLRSRIGR